MWRYDALPVVDGVILTCCRQELDLAKMTDEPAIPSYVQRTSMDLMRIVEDQVIHHRNHLLLVVDWYFGRPVEVSMLVRWLIDCRELLNAISLFAVEKGAARKTYAGGSQSRVIG